MYIDGIRYSIETIDLVFHRLENTLENLIAEPAGSNGKALLIVESISDAWVFVDSVHRLRRLILHTPGLKQKLPEVQLLLRESKKFEQLRNFVQHFSTEIHKFVEMKAPLWGTLSWVITNKETSLPETHTIVPGTFFHDQRIASCVFDTHEGKFVDRLVLHAGPARVDLADMYDRCEKFWKWFEECCANAFDQEKNHGSDVHIAFTIKQLPGPPEQIPKTNESE